MSVTKVSSAMQDLTDDYAFSGTVTGAGNPGRGTIGGLTLTNDGTDAAHDIGIAVGFARDYTDAATMSLTGALIKKIDATWAVGTNAGGLDSTDTVAANTGYGVYLIRRSDTGVVDVLMSSDMTAAGSALTMPTNYDQKRLIGWVRTDASSNIISFFQSGDMFKLQGGGGADVADSSITSFSYETATLTVPPLTLVGVYAQKQNNTETESGNYVSLKTKGSWEVATSQSKITLMINTQSDTLDSSGVATDIMVDANSQVEYACNESGGVSNFNITIYHVNMLTRSNP